MRALVTSGGTKIPLDEVRYISNFSKGVFGNKLADSLVFKNFQVDHLHCKDSPIAMEDDRYKTIEFWSYEDYFTSIKNLIQTNDYDIVFLAAAVSDYTTVPYKGKLGSKNDLYITLTPTIKIIQNLKQWAREAGRKEFVQVGFKLVAGDTKTSEMLEIAKKSGISNDSNFTIANHINDLSIKYVIRRDNKMTLYYQYDIDGILDFIMEKK